RRRARRPLQARPAPACGDRAQRRSVGRDLHRERLRLRRAVRASGGSAGASGGQGDRLHDERPFRERPARTARRARGRSGDGRLLGRRRPGGRSRGPPPRRPVVRDGSCTRDAPPADAPADRTGRRVGGRRVNERGRVLHMIGNAHIDPVWLWQWPEGYQEVRATFQSALDRMEEYPEFVFTCDSICFLQWVEETDPPLFEQIRARVTDGRWQVIGGWWIEPDCNIPGGESYVRQALYGQRWLRDRFGITATTGANLDSFGHNATLPQLLRSSGLDSYVFLRPGPHELALPGPIFWWESPDGSRVLAYRIPHEYCSPGADLGHHVDRALAQLPAEPEELMVFYGVGNHGGGPTRANLDSIRRLNETGALPRLEPSSPRAFFDSVAGNGDIPVHAGELQHHGVGCYSAHSGI